ncbi:MAG: FAD-binding oxidoreductase [Anaerolineae bacterium]|nr:FAD-binding oxidoreductase [Anaerolineae bacterium]
MTQFRPVSEEVLQQLESVVGVENLSSAESERRLRSHDMSHHAPHMAELVVWPTTARQVADVLRIANAALVPVTPWGAGSSLEGNPIPLFGGISLSFERMNRIVALHADDFQVTVQPGIGYKDLNAILARDGLFFAPDPGANASIGGMLANNAAGSRTVKYGATRDNVLATQVALADGRLIRTGSRSIKQSAGYDLTHLMIGSEGTLGVITEATLRLMPIATVMSGVLASFPTVAAAVEAVVAIRGSGLDVAALEFIDGPTAALISREEGVAWGERPILLMEVHATHAASAELDLALIEEICMALGVMAFRATTDSAERRQMWRARHHLFETLVRVFPGYKWQLMDIAVPISSLPALVDHVAQTLLNNELVGFVIGHAGDGNVHVTMPYNDEATRRRTAVANDTIVYKAIELGGTSTGEHGVGIGKAKFMSREHGAALDVMRTLKQALDPNGILNPGKIFSAE